MAENPSDSLDLELDDAVFSEALLNYINQILTEADVDSKLHDQSHHFLSLFHRGLEEGLKFLPTSTPQTPTPTLRKTRHHRDDADHGRETKHLALSPDDPDDETALSALFDKVLLCDRGRHHDHDHDHDHKPPTKSAPAPSNTVVDLRSLVLSCANAVSANDVPSANQLLLQLRLHSSPLGDGSQRMAHCFANALEARLAGTGTDLYASLPSNHSRPTQMLKAYQAYISACPFKKMAIIFANLMLFKTARNAHKLHIIDFGILYGFQWPAFIYYLSKRPGGPPKLRITGIELPQSGFRPSQQVHDTGTRLARYCQRFGVPFEYDAVAKRFEHVGMEDLRIEKDELLAVTCLLRFKHLLDETVVLNSPRDYVLRLIRELNPAIFVHSINSGGYTAPFFLPRFREALFDFSTFFDMADATFTREDPMRLMFEKEFVGREVINVVACEGVARVERPETYRQWEVRTRRAGFRALPLDAVAIRKLKSEVKRGYHREFTVEEDGSWMLQGWKGRVLFASSCWVPTL